MRLYEELEEALATTDEADLVRLASTRRRGEMALAACARRAISLRRFQLDGVREGAARVVAPPVVRPTSPERRRTRGRRWRGRSLVWEAVAFVLGFVLSFLLIAGGA